MYLYRIRQFIILAAAILCTMAMTLGCAANKSVTPNEVDEVKIKTTDPLKEFEEEYVAIRRKVEEDALSAEVMSRATEFRIGLQKYLIKTEAKLEILRLDALHGASAQREKALNQIVALVAEREQTKIAYLQELQAIKSGSKTSEDSAGQKGTVKDLDMEITIAPEDIGDGKRP